MLTDEKKTGLKVSLVPGAKNVGTRAHFNRGSNVCSLLVGALVSIWEYCFLDQHLQAKFPTLQQFVRNSSISVQGYPNNKPVRPLLTNVFAWLLLNDHLNTRNMLRRDTTTFFVRKEERKQHITFSLTAHPVLLDGLALAFFGHLKVVSISCWINIC